MKYVYFDIECASNIDGKAKICSLGYVVTTSSFNILEKDDIIINPNIDRKDYSSYVMKNIVKYTIDELEAKETFPFYYEKIKNLLENEDHVVFGYDVHNDIKDLIDECERYELPILKIKSYDVQKIYKEFAKIKDAIALGKLMKEFNIDLSLFTEHNSKDDAEMTMIATREICKKMNCDIDYLLEISKKGVVDYTNYNKNSTKVIKNKYVSKVRELNKNISEDTIKVCFSHSLDIDRLDEKKNFIERIYKKGFSCETSLTRCDYLVVGKKKDKLEEACDYIVSSGIKDIKKITMKEFLLMVKETKAKAKTNSKTKTRI